MKFVFRHTLAFLAIVIIYPLVHFVKQVALRYLAPRQIPQRSFLIALQ
jgi:hypothetical protein